MGKLIIFYGSARINESRTDVLIELIRGFPGAWLESWTIYLTCTSICLFIYKTAEDVVLVRISQVMLLNLSGLWSQKLSCLSGKLGLCFSSPHSRQIVVCLQVRGKEKHSSCLRKCFLTIHQQSLNQCQGDFRFCLLQQHNLPILTDGDTLVQMWPIQEVKVVKRVWCPKRWCECP